MRYPWGETMQPKVANDGGTTTTPVDAFPDGRSPFGLCDMSGNVWHDRFVQMGLGKGERSARPTEYHVKLFLMSASEDRKSTIGFRCVKDVVQTAASPSR